MNGNFHIFFHGVSLILWLLIAICPKWLGLYSYKRKMMLRIMGTILVFICIWELIEDFKKFEPLG